MCTVTLIPSAAYNNNFILTSNRDEAAGRATIPPKKYTHNKTKLLFPKDELAGGTWIGVSERSRLICLLNGGFKDHVRQSFYRKSRGVVVKDLLAAVNFDRAVSDYDFSSIEPFTIILVEWVSKLRFLELVWDGREKHITPLDLIPHIWSSSPLYSADMKLQRNSWFNAFLAENIYTPGNLWDFHHNAGVGDNNLDLIMDRGFVKTKSITQVAKVDERVVMKYEDLEKAKIFEAQF